MWELEGEFHNYPENYGGAGMDVMSYAIAVEELSRVDGGTGVIRRRSAMYNVRNITPDYYWVGANEHRLALFENIHPIPRGVSYNAYLLMDQATVLADTFSFGKHEVTFAS